MAAEEPPPRASNHLEDASRSNGDGDEDEVAETDPAGRYYRYREVVGRGRFKHIYKAFDTQIGIDVAWSKIAAEPHHLSEQQLESMVDEMEQGLNLEHPNIIKCFKCWKDKEHHCVNLITELFTSGNLRQYRNLHKHLDLKAVKRMARQILKGLAYLHSKSPAVTHGDLRCDKIYVNGHSGEIKIGDLGLATLLPRRWDDAAGEAPPGLANNQGLDIFAFGLCMLELLTLKQLDPQHCADAQGLIGDISDAEARAFVGKCLEPPSLRPTAAELLEDPFLLLKKPAPTDHKLDEHFTSDAGATVFEKRSPTEDSDEGNAPIAIGKLRGEDYNFEFQGKVKEGKMHFRLVMTQANDVIMLLPAGSDAGAPPASSDGSAGTDGAQPPLPPLVRTVDFVFDPDVDTADDLAAELSEKFNLSSTDTEICAAALREWLAKEMPAS